MTADCGDVCLRRWPDQQSGYLQTRLHLCNFKLVQICGPAVLMCVLVPSDSGEPGIGVNYISSLNVIKNQVKLHQGSQLTRCCPLGRRENVLSDMQSGCPSYSKFSLSHDPTWRQTFRRRALKTFPHSPNQFGLEIVLPRVMQPLAAANGFWLKVNLSDRSHSPML